MFDLVIIDVIIGLVFVYLLYSLLATIIQEIIATNFNFRAKILEKAVMRMLDDGDSSKNRVASFFMLFTGNWFVPPMTKLFYNHPLIKYLSPDKWHKKPSYLSAQNFSKVIVDLLRGKQTIAGQSYRENIEGALSAKKPAWNEEIKISDDTSDFLNSIWVDAQGDIDKFKTNLELWYDETMDRATGWYKQYTQVVLLIVGMTIAIIFNVDTLKIVEKLEKDPVLREQLVSQSEAFAKAHPNLIEELNNEKKRNEAILASLKDSTRVAKEKMDSVTQARYDTLKTQRDSLFARANRLVKGDISKINKSLALGWGDYGGRTGTICKARYVLSTAFGSWSKFFGLFITAIAISLGAPFWFDLLNKLIKLRGAFKGGEGTTKKDEKAKEGTVKRVG